MKARIKSANEIKDFKKEYLNIFVKMESFTKSMNLNLFTKFA